MFKSLSLRMLYLLFAVSLLNVSYVYAANQSSKKLDINKATVAQLVKVKGVGKAKAKAIVLFIKSKHSIKNMDELLKVKGIGKKVLKNIEEKFYVVNVKKTK